MKSELTKQELDNFLQGNYTEDITQDELKELFGTYVGGIYYMDDSIARALCFTKSGAHFTLEMTKIKYNSDELRTGARIIIGIWKGYDFSAWAFYEQNQKLREYKSILGTGVYSACHPINCFRYGGSNADLPKSIQKIEFNMTDEILYLDTRFIGCDDKCIVIDESTDSVVIGRIHSAPDHHPQYSIKNDPSSRLPSRQFNTILDECHFSPWTLGCIDDEAHSMQSIFFLPNEPGPWKRTEEAFSRFWKRMEQATPLEPPISERQTDSSNDVLASSNPLKTEQEAIGSETSHDSIRQEFPRELPDIGSLDEELPDLQPRVAKVAVAEQDGDAPQSPARADAETQAEDLLCPPPRAEQTEANSYEDDSVDVIAPSEVSKGTDGNVTQNTTDEVEFLLKFIHSVEECGFDYNPQDLIRFHTSVKTGYFTLLGGAPGSGKSSLAKLYAMALLGNGEKMNIQDGFLPIDVNPAWVEPDDVLGYWGLGDGDYVPSSTGLVPFLRDANSSEKIHLVCLEEMNLARVEHYFANFMQAFDREESERILYGIPAGKEEKNHARLKISPSVRFVGTNNFDETTQNFSARFYDRSNYIELQNAGDREPFSKGVPKFEKSLFDFGVRWDDYEKWFEKTPVPDILDKDIKNLYKELRESLKELRIAPSRRVENDILVYIANRPFFKECGRGDVASPAERLKVSLDEAIAQRVLPRYHVSYLRDESKIYDELASLLGTHGLSLSQALLEERRKTFGETPALQ